jgi:protein-L-isoaspartate(D-aspartate) O-methyltransferase
VGDALAEAPESFDILYSSAGIGTLPLPWLQALRVGGRMVLPITGPHDHGMVFLLHKIAEDRPWRARMLSFTRHYPCLGTRSEAELDALEQALSKPPSMVTSLRLDPHEAEATCWLHGNGWCLSSEAI